MKGKKKIRPATKIAIGFVVIVVALFFGYRSYNVWRVSGLSFEPIAPARVNLVGVDTGVGYHIVVANNMAQLVRGANPGMKHDTDYNAESSAQDAEKKRVPMRELLESLQGNEKSLSRFVMVMNDLNEGELPPQPAIWKAEDIRKALDGDAELIAKLQHDLNVKLDGTPMDTMTVKAVEEGIVIDAPVVVNVQVGNTKKAITARILQSYTPTFIQNVQRRYQGKNYTVDQIVGYYSAMAKDILEARTPKENVRGSLEANISEARSKALAERPELILSSANVIINEKLISDARMTERKLSDGRTVYDIDLDLTEEGRMRLWQYSLNRVGAQLLFIWDGNAIAAPAVQHELSQTTVTVKGVGDYRLAKATVDTLKNLEKGGS
ncbi:MAG: hypothetical protein KF784_03165 [Fimbriimonadaceae bacterium]|nr:hypothetical protein [Fimbriimonadaceae bacterium]